MKYIRQIVLCLVLTSGLAASAADAFSSLATSLPKMKAVFSKILADTPDFSANAVVGMFATNGTMLAKMPIDFALTADRMREGIDVMQMPFPQEVRDVMQKSHLDKIDIITQTDTKKIFIVFPGIEAYQEYPISDDVLDEMTTRTKNVSIKRKEYKQEMIENHPCTQATLVVSETNRPTEIAILRCATDLQNFPIRMDILTPTSTTRFMFENVQLKKPDAALFEVPANYTAFTNTADIMRYAREKFQSSSDNAPQ
jgi:hypothetical protein